MPSNFKIVPSEDDYMLMPITDMGRSLADHCQYHGKDLIYPTLAGAKERQMMYDQAIEIRGGRPWARFK